MADAHLLDPDAELSGHEEWTRLVEKLLGESDFSTLQSRTRDDIVIEPLYPARSDVPPLHGRGARSWTIDQIVDDPDPEQANLQALADVAGGAAGLALRFAGAASAVGLGLPVTEEALRTTLDGVDLAAVGVRIDAHPRVLESADWLQQLVARQGVAPELADISWGLDPAALATAGGRSETAPETLARLFSELHVAGFRGALAEIDTRAFHEAGGSEALELAAFLAGATCWLRALSDAGIAAEIALSCFGATFAVDRDQFLSIAKLRAARLLWRRLAELCGAPAARLRIHAETSRRMMTRADPHSNLLRTTIAAFAAGVGAADSLTILPFTAALGLADRSARALARNIQHLLMQEAHLHRAADPAAGSGLVEALTEQLAEKAWAGFQAIEREGGILGSLRKGALQKRIATAREGLRAELAGGAAPLVGATVFRQADALAADCGGAAGVPEPVHGLAPVRLEALAQVAA